MKDLIIKFFKFGVVGASGVILDFGITWLLKEKAKINQYIANSTGFGCAVLSNYVLNRVWTFHSHDSAIGMQFTKFFVVALIGLGMNNALIYWFNERQKLSFYLSKAIATAIVMVWNFGANYLFTFTS